MFVARVARYFHLEMFPATGTSLAKTSTFTNCKLKSLMWGMSGSCLEVQAYFVLLLHV